MHGSELDERSFFRAIATSGARVLIADIQLLTGLRDKEGSS